METSKACSNCGANERFSTNGPPLQAPNFLPVGFFAGAKYRLVVCGACGLTRWFVPAEFLPLVKEKFDTCS